MDKQEQQGQQQEKGGFTIVSLDAFFFYESCKEFGLNKIKRPVVRVTGSHQRSCVFGAISMEESNNNNNNKKKQLFRQYNIFNGDTFLDYLKKYIPNLKNVICSWIKHLLIINQRRC